MTLLEISRIRLTASLSLRQWKPNQRRGEQRASESLVPFHLMEKKPSFFLFINPGGGLPPGRGEWPSGQKRQTVNLLKVFYVGSNPASPTSDSREEKGRICQRKKANQVKKERRERTGSWRLRVACLPSHPGKLLQFARLFLKRLILKKTTHYQNERRSIIYPRR